MTDYTEQTTDVPIETENEGTLAILYPEKFCPACKEMKKRAKFNRKKSNKTGLQTHCRDCQRIENGVQRKDWHKKKNLTKRRCLSCLKMFPSTGKFNRVCDPCKKKRHYSEQEWGGLRAGILNDKV